MSYLESLLTQATPLESYERLDLNGWLTSLQSDMEVFGETPEDQRKVERIRAKLAEPQESENGGA